ncbi:hypothetical protein PROFUN_06770 [Planoprotostelium fungivorum]|uniref:Uncharacterized protein n=1 Tax=Planoprotostelium fungivorum TaxID=1890364 RepID=A0A2P6NNR4_9EUKA|nr:hypothetical protein PROFUN_06770 [Planoprotostelium fungivorum]
MASGSYPNDLKFDGHVYFSPPSHSRQQHSTQSFDGAPVRASEDLDFTQIERMRIEHAKRLSQIEQMYYQQLAHGSDEYYDDVEYHQEDDVEFELDYEDDDAAYLRQHLSDYNDPEYWRTKTSQTVPQPFSFAERDAAKHAYKYYTSHHSSQNHDRIPKANPVPSFVKAKKVDKILKAEDERKKNFVTPSVRVVPTRKPHIPEPPPPPPVEYTFSHFKARPVPKSVLEPKFHEIQEKEKQRKSKFIVPTVKSPSKYPFQPKITPHVPRFHELHEKLEEKKVVSPKKQIEIKEFKLKTSKIPSKREKVLMDIHHDAQEGVELRWPYTSTRGKVVHHAPPPTHSPRKVESTLAHELKTKVAKMKIKDRETKEKQEKEMTKKQKEKWKNMSRVISQRIPADTSSYTINSRASEKRKDFEEQDKQYFDDMHSKLQQNVSQRTFLFERHDKEGMRRQALRRADEIIANAGLSPHDFRYKTEVQYEPDHRDVSVGDAEEEEEEEESEEEESEEESEEEESEEEEEYSEDD